MPGIAKGEKVLQFGDLKNYWVADRQNRTFRRLNELYARTDQVGFMTTQRVDGRLILPESVKVLKMAGNKSNTAGGGNAGRNGGPSGDLMVNVRIKPHELFTREGSNVYCEMPISFCQAACGADIEVPTLDGKVRYNVPEGTQTGTTFRLKGKGIPYVGYKNRGDQYVTVVVEPPTKLTKEQKELLREFAEATEKAQPKRKSFFDKLKRNFG
jgi:DnaJ-class molecular chaperone